jgi:zinc transport system substrate-binding protein
LTIVPYLSNFSPRRQGVNSLWKELMIKVTHVLILVVLLWSGSAFRTPLEAREVGKPLRVICTILPIYSLTLNVVGQTPNVLVELLLPAHQGCPHNYDLTPGDLMKLARADLIIANGLGMEEFLDQFIKKVKAKAPIILATEKIQPILNQSVPDRLGPGKKTIPSGHDHEDLINGHAWVSPKSAAIMVRTIAEGLASKDPARAATYRSNAKQYSAKLEDLSRDMKEVVSRAKNRNVIAFHDVLAYLARDIGLNVVGVVQSQLGIEPSSKELVRLVKLIKDRQVSALFSEPQYSDKVVQTLSRESGIPFFELDPVATGKPAADTYEKVMKGNLEILRKAIR